MFECFNGARCLITGGAGFIGKALMNRLHKLGAEICCIDTSGCLGQWCKDVRDLWQMDSEFKSMFEEGKKEGYVFHLASLTEVAESYERPYDYYEVALLGTLNILELCRKYRTGICKVVVASSDKAYGNRESYSLPYSESDDLIPSLDPYGNSKRLMDLLCQDYIRTFGIPVRILRCCNIYGPGQTNETTLITQTIKRFIMKQPAIIHHASKRHCREWMYIDDAVTAYLIAAMKPINRPHSAWDHIWNVGSGYEAIPKEIIDRIALIMGIKLRDTIEYVPEERVTRVGDQKLNSNRFLDNVSQDWRTTTLEEGLNKTILWYLNYYSQQALGIK